MKLYLDGITRNTESPKIIAELKKAGYVEVKEAVPEDQPKTEKKAAGNAAKDGG